jgi:hypothetical protein
MNGAGLRGGRPEGKSRADDRRPGDLADQLRDHRPQAGKDLEPGREEQKQGLHREAQEDGEPRDAKECASQPGSSVVRRRVGFGGLLRYVHNYNLHVFLVS